MSNAPQRKQLYFVATIFLLPLLLAALMYSGIFSWQPSGRTNHGELLQPIVNLGDADLQPTLRALSNGASDKHWLLIYVNTAACEATCQESLYRLRQSRLMLGSEMARVKRVFLHGSAVPDKVFIEQQHEGLLVLGHPDLGDFLRSQRPEHVPAGGLFLVDPLGNLVMYFAAELLPRDMVTDIKHLLDLSRIG